MNHQDYVNLIKNAVPNTAGVWVDLGSGEGAFTLALVELLHSGSKIYSIDQNSASLKAQEAKFRTLFPLFTIYFHTGDFTSPLTLHALPLLDGILMANSLHFIEDKVPVLKNLKKLLKPGGRLVIVEYNVDTGNHWVPYPFSFATFKELATKAGFKEVQLAGKTPSVFLNQMYCAYTYTKCNSVILSEAKNL
jgi:ubiquinone/menaquinone biosynthesis C-methylase UbiE